MVLVGGKNADAMISNCLRSIVSNAVAGQFTYYGTKSKFPFVETPFCAIIKGYMSKPFNRLSVLNSPFLAETVRRKYPALENDHFKRRLGRVLTESNPREHEPERRRLFED